MKHVHDIDLGQWSSACRLVTDARALKWLYQQMTGGPPPTIPVARGGVCFHLIDARGSWLIIAIGKPADRDELATTLAHEATHAMRWILEHDGEQSPGTETQAYLVEYIVRQCLAAVPA